jgi:molybdopterin synthase catalytic subunit
MSGMTEQSTSVTRPSAASAAGPPLVRHAIDPQRLLSAVAAEDAGANVLFVGTTRGTTRGIATSRLEYEAHEPMAESRLAALRDEAVRRFGLKGCAVVHRLGVVAVGESSVAIATSGPHRREAFEAAQWLMDRIKQEVPIWKCEERPDGSREWVHPGGSPPAAPAAVAGGGDDERH